MCMSVCMKTDDSDYGGKGLLTWKQIADCA